MNNNEFPFNHFFSQNISSKPKENNGFSKRQSIKSLNTDSHKFPSPQLKPESQYSSKDLELLSSEIKNFLKSNISPLKYSLYFQKTFTVSRITEKEVFFNVQSNYVKNQIEDSFLDIITKSINDILGLDLKLIFVVNEKPEQSPTVSVEGSNRLQDSLPELPQKLKSVKEATFKLNLTPTKEDLQDNAESRYLKHLEGDNQNLIIDPRKTFDNFIIGPSNNMAFVTMKAVAEEPSRPNQPGRYPSIYIYSNSGLGKTHLLHSVANKIFEKYPELNLCLITAREFMKEMIVSIQNNTLGSFQKKYSEKIDILMIDDIHELENKHGTQNEFFHIFNELHNKGKQLIFTSDKPPKEINGIAERIRTRLQWGLVIDIQKPDFETRMAILKKKAYELDLFISDDIISTIANNIKTSIRELEGSLIKLSAYSEVMKVDIDMEMVKELLVLNDNTGDKRITLEHITRTTAQFYKITLADIKSKTRTKQITNARHIAMYLSQKVINSKLQEIGKYFSGRDHTSVMHAIKKVKSSLKTDLALSRQIVEIENSL
jgi:chromosomal replication initiator protein